ncbi:MAG: LacI family DNA-binding transcriptional regulator [Lachnospiraceae bacterium]|jgi:LacI family transcriptional regulator
MATIRDVARLAGVSQATVSRILNKDETISVTPEVRLRIFQAASQLNYVPPRQRRAANAKKKLVIGVADWQIIRPDRPNVRLHSLDLLVRAANDKYETEFTRLVYGMPQTVDGIIAFGVFQPEEIAFLHSLSYAIVFVNSEQRNYENDQVQVDYQRGLEEIVSYLLDRKHYASVGYIGGIYEDPQEHRRIGGKRLQSLKDILSERGQYQPSLFHVGTISRESGFELALEASRSGTLAKAVILGNDEVAEGAMEAFEELNLQIPKDVAVVMYQDIQTMESKWPDSTCIEMYPDYVWENALEMLFGRIEKTRMNQPVTIMIPAGIRIGNTA